MEHLRFISALAVVAAATTLIHCSKDSSSASPTGKTCNGAQALQTIGLRGTSMPAKSIALTFDDGPGPRTKVLSAFLKEEGIEAAFFVNGKSMGAGSDAILQALVDDGHLVANHTETHRSFTGTATATTRLTDPEIIQEVTDTDAKIANFVTGDRFLFRPPFGDFDEQAINVLSGTPMSKYVGPIMWDIGDRMDEAKGRVADVDCWQDGVDAKRIPMTTCGDLYVTEIKRATRGIVLLHDPYFNEADPEQLGTVDMVKYIVPILKAEGFTFLRVDKVPEIAALLPPLASGGVDGGTSDASSSGSADAAVSGDTPCP